MRLLLSTLLALALVPAASASPRQQTITGTVSANSGVTLTVSSGDRSLTCSVTSAAAQAAIARWGVGPRAAMACRQDGDHLVLTRLTRLGTKEPGAKDPGAKDPEHGTTTTGTTTTTGGTTPAPEPSRRDARGKVTALGASGMTVTRPDGGSLTCSVTAGQLQSVQQGAPVGSYVLVVCSGSGDRPALVSVQRIDASSPPPPPATTPAPPAPAPAPAAERRQAIGIVVALSSDAVTVKPDTGDSLRCRITPASDSTAAAGKLALGARVGIVCRRDGDGWVLAGSTPG